jgi:glucosylceramidase
MAKVIITEKDSNKRFYEEVLNEKKIENVDFVIDDSITYQSMVGFGGAFTESAAYNLSRVDESVRDEAIKAYFDKDEGLGYTIGRVSIHSCDFSLNSYTYIEEGDTELKTFDISRDLDLVNIMLSSLKNIVNKILHYGVLQFKMNLRQFKDGIHVFIQLNRKETLLKTI